MKLKTMRLKSTEHGAETKGSILKTIFTVNNIVIL